MLIGVPVTTSSLKRSTLVDFIRHAVFGFFMGAADTVPGVSGGTVAFVCGIYERLIDAIRDASRAAVHVVRGRRRAAVTQLRELDLALLVPLLLGLMTAVLSLASAIEHLLESEPVALAGLFFGLVLGSVAIAWRLLRRPDRRAVLIMVASAAVFFVGLGLREGTTAEAAETATAAMWTYPAAGAIAICAMILPGISGSFLLVMMGMYDDVLGAVNDRDIAVLALFAMGCAVGLAAFSRLLAWLMERHHDVVVAVLIGLMLGSVRVLWPWPGGTATTELAAPSGGLAAPLILAAVGLVAVLALGRFGALREEAPPHPG